jgi:hypothetical protein
MAPTTTDTLRVPGAHLYYEVRGSGPVLPLICGGSPTPPGTPGLRSSSPTGTRCTSHPSLSCIR